MIVPLIACAKAEVHNDQPAIDPPTYPNGGDDNGGDGFEKDPEIPQPDKIDFSKVFTNFNAFKSTFKISSTGVNTTPNFIISEVSMDNNGYSDQEFDAVNKFASFQDTAYFGYKFDDNFYQDKFANGVFGGNKQVIDKTTLIPLSNYLDKISFIFSPSKFTLADTDTTSKFYQISESDLKYYAMDAKLGYSPKSVKAEVRDDKFFKIDIVSTDDAMYQYTIKLDETVAPILPSYQATVKFTLDWEKINNQVAVYVIAQNSIRCTTPQPFHIKMQYDILFSYPVEFDQPVQQGEYMSTTMHSKNTGSMKTLIFTDSGTSSTTRTMTLYE